MRDWGEDTGQTLLDLYLDLVETSDEDTSQPPNRLKGKEWEEYWLGYIQTFEEDL